MLSSRPYLIEHVPIEPAEVFDYYYQCMKPGIMQSAIYSKLLC